MDGVLAAMNKGWPLVKALINSEEGGIICTIMGQMVKVLFLSSCVILTDPLFVHRQEEKLYSRMSVILSW